MFQTEFRAELIDSTAFIAPGAIIVGEVTIGAESSVWFQSSLRADTTPVTIGQRTNVQEGSIFHADPGYPAVVGDGVTIGHGAIVHGAKVGDNALIGIRAVLLNGVIVGENCLVGAGSLLTPGKEFPPNTLILGSPAKVIRELTAEEIAGNRETARTYVMRAKAFRQSMAQS